MKLNMLDLFSGVGLYENEIKKVAATNRYKCLGNAVTVDVIQAVGESILKSMR